MAKKLKLKEIVARNLSALREQAGLTQSALAKRAGVTGRYISILETKPKNLTLETLEKICDVLGVSPCELICERKYIESPKVSIDTAIHILQKASKDYS